MSAPIVHTPTLHSFTPCPTNPCQGVLKVGSEEYDVTITLHCDLDKVSLNLAEVASEAFYILEKQGLINEKFKEATLSKDGIINKDSKKLVFKNEIKEFAQTFFNKLENPPIKKPSSLLSSIAKTTLKGGRGAAKWGLNNIISPVWRKTKQAGANRLRKASKNTVKKLGNMLNNWQRTNRDLNIRPLSTF